MSSTMVSLIVSLLFVLILVAGFLVGMWRGLKKSAVNLGFAFAGVLIAFFITPLITNAIVGAKITIDGTSMPIKEVAVYLMKQDADMALLLASNANLEKLALNLPSAIINAVLFMVLTCIIEGILYIVYKIIAKFTMQNHPREKKYRLWGGAVGLVKTFVVALFAFMPLSSLVGLVGSMVGESTVVSTEVADADEGSEQTTSLLADHLSPEIVEIIKGLNGNAWTVCCGVTGLDDVMLDYYASVKIDGEKLSVREEVANVYQTANSVYGVQQALSNPNIKFSSLDYDGLSVVLEDLVEGPLFRIVVAETLGEVLVNYQDYGFLNGLNEYEEVLQNVSAGLTKEKTANGSYYGYFANDIRLAFDAFRALGESGMIDDAVEADDGGIGSVMSVLTSDKYQTNFSTAVLKLFDMNLLRASAKTVSQLVVDVVMTDEEVGVDTSSWTDANWEDEADALVGVIELCGEVLSQVSLDEITTDFTAILEKDVDITKLFSNIGKLCDSITQIKLFHNANNESVFVSFVEDEVGIKLPAEKVYDNEGKEVSIENYQQMFEFIAPSLDKLVEEKLYDTFMESENVVVDLADVLSQNGKQNLLSEIILPLVQIDFTKNIIDDVLASAANDLIDFGSLTTYHDWKGDLDYISSLLVTLNSHSVAVNAETKTYLDLVVSGDLSTLMKVLKESEVEDIFKPLFYAKSTASTKSQVLNQIVDIIEKMTSIDVTMPETYTLQLNHSEDQVQEICNVMKKLITINKFADGEGKIDIKEIDSETLGGALEEMKANAYRTSNGKTEMGIFGGENGAFVALIEYAKSDYETEIDAIPTIVDNADILEISEEDADKYASYYSNLKGDNYQTKGFNAFKDIDYMQLFADFAEISEKADQLPTT